MRKTSYELPTGIDGLFLFSRDTSGDGEGPEAPTRF
jgi:hypothetical protein